MFSNGIVVPKWDRTQKIDTWDGVIKKLGKGWVWVEQTGNRLKTNR